MDQNQVCEPDVDGASHVVNGHKKEWCLGAWTPVDTIENTVTGQEKNISPGERTSPLYTVRKNPKKRTRSDLEVDYARPRRTMNTAQSSVEFMSMDTRGYIGFHYGQGKNSSA